MNLVLPCRQVGVCTDFTVSGVIGSVQVCAYIWESIKIGLTNRTHPQRLRYAANNAHARAAHRAEPYSCHFRRAREATCAERKYIRTCLIERHKSRPLDSGSTRVFWKNCASPKAKHVKWILSKEREQRPKRELTFYSPWSSSTVAEDKIRGWGTCPQSTSRRESASAHGPWSDNARRFQSISSRVSLVHVRRNELTLAPTYTNSSSGQLSTMVVRLSSIVKSVIRWANDWSPPQHQRWSFLW